MKRAFIKRGSVQYGLNRFSSRKIKVPFGYYLVKEKGIIQKEDLYVSYYGTWTRTGDAGHPMPENLDYIRKIS